MRASRTLEIARTLRIVAEIRQEPDEHRTVNRARFGSVRPSSEIAAGSRNGAGVRCASQSGGAVFLGLSDLRAAGQADRFRVDAERLGELAQLGGDVGPFAKTQIVEELGAAHPPERGAGELAALDVQISPQCEECEEIRGTRGEAGVQLIGLRALVGGALADVLNRECRNQH